jgi:glycosyltransferase involved in cell wall biosynthesis
VRRVLVLIHTPFFGGLHNIVSRIAAPMRDHGWEMIVGCPDGPGILRLREEAVACIPLSLHRARRTLNPVTHVRTALGLATDIRDIRRAIRDCDIRLVVVAGLVNPHGGFAARAENVPVVWQIHSDFAPMWLRRVMVPVVRRLADSLMVCGQAIADSHPGVEAFGERMVRFAAPVDTRMFRPDMARRAQARRSFEVTDDRFVVGTVGVRTFQKGHEYLVEAAAIVRKHVPGVAFRVMGAAVATGETYYERDVIGRARALGLTEDDTVRFLDPKREVSTLLPGLDAFALSSRSEGIPTALLEAMSCGLPSVCTNVGSAAEVISDGVNGELVRKEDPAALANAIIALARSPERRDRYRLRGRETVERAYSIEHAVESHCRAFEIALSGGVDGRREFATGGALAARTGSLPDRIN